MPIILCFNLFQFLGGNGKESSRGRYGPLPPGNILKGAQLTRNQTMLSLKLPRR